MIKLIQAILLIVVAHAFSLRKIPPISEEIKTEFKGKFAFVTGGSSGMGYTTVLTLAQYGAQVVFIARNSHPTWFTGE